MFLAPLTFEENCVVCEAVKVAVDGLMETCTFCAHACEAVPTMRSTANSRDFRKQFVNARDCVNRGKVLIITSIEILIGIYDVELIGNSSQTKSNMQLNTGLRG